MQPPNDFGPIYAETNLSQFPVEPLNTYSNIIFLLIVLWIAKTTRLDYRHYPLLVIALPILFIGFIGGTIFHATRSHSIWLILDFVPIIILAFLAATHFWIQVLGRRLEAIIFTLLIISLPRLLFIYSPLPRGTSISIGYSILATVILLPAAIISRRQAWADAQLLILSAVTFVIALLFRTFDRQIAASLMPAGSHFLWHIFGGVSVFAMLLFITRGYNRVIGADLQTDPQSSLPSQK